MSMNTSVVYGYGFEVREDNKVLADFIINHKETIKKRGYDSELELLEVCEAGDYNEMGDFDCDIESEISTNCGLWAIVANIMNEETDIGFEYDCSNIEDTKAILFCPYYPWQMNEKEKNLTFEELDEIVSNYVNELGIVTTVGYIEVESFG